MTEHKIPKKRRRLPCLETRAPFNLITIIAVYLHSIAGRELRCTAQRLHGAGEHTIRPVATTPTDPGSGQKLLIPATARLDFMQRGIIPHRP